METKQNQVEAIIAIGEDNSWVVLDCALPPYEEGKKAFDEIAQRGEELIPMDPGVYKILYTKGKELKDCLMIPLKMEREIMINIAVDQNGKWIILGAELETKENNYIFSKMRFFKREGIRAFMIKGLQNIVMEPGIWSGFFVVRNDFAGFSCMTKQGYIGVIEN